MIKNYFYDTESIGFFSPTVLLQYAIDDGEPIIHQIFKEPVQSTLSIIEDMMANNVIGFNLAHDHFHLSRTYGVFQMLPRFKPPKVMDIWDCESEDEAHDKYCLKPHGALDLMLYGRNNEFQATMNQKDIVIRKVPTNLADPLIKELEQKVDIPKIYFARRDGESVWKKKLLHEGTGKEVTPEELAKFKTGELEDLRIDKDFVNLRLGFYPSTGLKPIMKFLLNKDVDLIEDMLQFKKPVEYTWRPDSGGWLDVAMEHIRGWEQPRRLKYARDDVYHTRDLFEYFNSPYHAIGDDDSMLACMVGGLHWKGYNVDLGKAKEQRDVQFNICEKAKARINYNSPRQVVQFLKQNASTMEAMLIEDSTEKTLEALLKSGSDKLKECVQLVLDGRHADKKLNLLDKLLIAKRLYVTFKVVGTKSNRMSGGSFNGKGGSINPQGIKKGSDIREVFTLAPTGYKLDNGDFDGYEVAISEAVYGDANLRKDLLSGKSIHALWGASLYNKTYEEIKATDGIPANEPNGYYVRSKNSFFAQLFGAQTPKIAEITRLSEEEVYDAKKRFEERYPGIGEAREKLFRDFEAMSQPNGIGTAIVWKEPAEYAESFLGFKRYFTLEFKVVQALFNLAQDTPEHIKAVGQLFKVKRRDRVQTGSGACQSAIFSAAFSLQSGVIRAALNHMIQSPGGQMTKMLQADVWKLQPTGITDWKLMPMNIHDELQCPVLPEYQDRLEETINKFIEENRTLVPLLGMTWKRNCKSWAEK